jgi:hypothetical protein
MTTSLPTMDELITKERCLALAAKYTPAKVKVIPVKGKSHKGMAHLGHENEDGCRVMEAPVPDNIAALWVYLHECEHFHLHGAGLPVEGNNLSRGEAEVNLAVMRILDEEGIQAPLDVLVDEYQSFLDCVRQDDLNWERHPLCTPCIAEFQSRIAGPGL